MENQSPAKSNPTAGSEQLIALAEQLSKNTEVLFTGAGSVSFKTSAQDPFGDPLDILVYQPCTAASTSYNLAELKRCPALKDASQLVTVLARAQLSASPAGQDFEAVFHALLPGKVAAFTCPISLMALDLQANPKDNFATLYGDQVLWLAESSDAALAQTLSGLALQDAAQGVFVHQRGLFVWGEDAPTVYNRLVAFIAAAEQDFGTLVPNPCADSIPAEVSRKTIAELRYKLSAAAGIPLLIRVLSNSAIQALPAEAVQLLISGPLSTPQARIFGNGVLTSDALPETLPANNILLDAAMGLLITGQTAADLERNVAVACKTLQAVLLANASGKTKAAALQPGIPPAATARREHDKDTMFVGEIALVTGAASGIGRGCALSLLNRGAVVIGLDINPDIAKVSDSPAYLGLACDLADEAAVDIAYNQVVQAFGGLDMVVLNAGIFPKSAMVSEMDLALWQRVMHINLDANVTILRESYPLLKQAPDKGRVLVNASRNVPAPGPGAAAYSTSKAGLTQLARVAALEWGKDGIRVNMIHPHAVFDTGIWTDEVLNSRAEKYGVTVQEYKTRNVLKVELTSHDIGELVCEMLGPVFSKTTGAQVPVDGGSDRVI